MNNKKNLLFICHRIPYPPNKGDKIRSFNMLKRLCEAYNVYLACMVDDEKDVDGVRKLKEYAVDVYYDLINPKVKKILSITAFAASKPISVPYFYSASIQRSIDGLLDNHQVDIVFGFSSPTAEYVFRSKHYHGRLRKAKWIMDLIDVDSYKWKQYAKTCSFPMNWIYKMEARYLMMYEKRVLKEFRHVLLTTEDERSLLGRYAPVSNVHAVGNGVDFEFFSPLHKTSLKKDSPVLLFTGVMDYWPNVEGVKWFVEKVYPMVLEAVPDVTFYIVGKNPTAEIKGLTGKKGIVVTGFVEDVRDYYAAADVCLVPLRIARGIQNKVLEAMAMGKALVSTPQALEGITASAGSDMIVEEDERAFANAAVKLLEDESLRTEMGKRARQCIEDSYSWESNLDKLAALLDN